MKREDAIKEIKEFYQKGKLLREEYYKNLAELEKAMSEKVGIGLEFSTVGDEIVGICAKLAEDKKYFPFISYRELEDGTTI